MNAEYLFNLYAKIFAKRKFIKLNKFLFNLSLRGMGVLNYKDNLISGEYSFLKNYFKSIDTGGVIFDVGANVGNYSEMIIENCTSLPIYAFEPHPITFSELNRVANIHNFCAINIGMSDRAGKITLYDYFQQKSSSHASLYKDVFTQMHKKEIVEYDVNVSTIDLFCDNYNIDNIVLLKIDTEGHEYAVLKGAKKMLGENRINAIHFEFNEMNVISKIFLNDIIQLLPDFSFYRLLPNELLEVMDERSCFQNIFAYQNIVAIHN